MKVAVCVSGKVNSAYNLIKRNNNVLKEKFPNADFYYATWEDQKEIFYRNFPNDKCFIFKEPDINYHPYWPEDIILNPYFKEAKNYIIRSKHEGLNSNKRGALCPVNMEIHKKSFQSESVERQRNSEFMRPSVLNS